MTAKNLTVRSKETGKIPKGAKIISKNIQTVVEEIENGYLIIKSYDIEYSLGDKNDYRHFSKKLYSKENPVEIKNEAMLADNFQ